MRLCRKSVVIRGHRLLIDAELYRPSHMKELFRLSKAKGLVWKELPNGDHNNTVGERGYFQHVNDFLEQYVLKGP